MLAGAWLLITFLLLLGAVLLRQVPLLLVAVLFFLASGVARLWARYALERLEYSRALSASRAFFGDTVTLEVRIANRKLLPLPWVHVTDEVPEDVTFLKGKTSPSSQVRRAFLSHFISLSWYQQLSRRYPIQCLRRGLFTFGPTTIRSGDLFGFFHRDMTDETIDRLLVYPRIVPLDELGIPSKDPFGDLRVRRHLFQDPVRVASTREYAPGDPLKRIHWMATARQGRLQSRVFEPTTSVDLALFLDVRTLEPPSWGSNEQLFETAIIVAASIANYATEHGYRMGLYVNQPYRHSDQVVKLPPSDHPDQLLRVLEALAQLFPQELMPLDRMVEREAPSLPWSATLVVVTALPTEALLASLSRLRRAGRPVALVRVGGQADRLSYGRLRVYHVSEQVYWRELASVRLATGGGPP